MAAIWHGCMVQRCETGVLKDIWTEILRGGVATKAFHDYNLVFLANVGIINRGGEQKGENGHVLSTYYDALVFYISALL